MSAATEQTHSPEGTRVMSQTQYAQEQPERELVVMLASLLDARGMTVVELAQRTGISRNNLDKLKNGRTQGTTWRTLKTLCLVLECGPGDLVHLSAEPIVLDDESYGRWLAERAAAVDAHGA